MADAVSRAGLAVDAVGIERLDAPGPRCFLGVGTAYPASMIKTPLAVAVAAAVEAGRLHWDGVLHVDERCLTVNDAPSPLVEGARTSVGEALHLMLARSDNVATNLLVDAVGRDAATTELHRLGFGGTAIRRKVSGSLPLIADPEATGRNTHPAADALALFCRLDAGSLPGTERIMAALAEQYWTTKLPAGLDADDRFAHKTGDTDEVSHDGGILTLANGRRFALVVYTALPSSDAVDAAFAHAMRELRPILAV